MPTLTRTHKRRMPVNSDKPHKWKADIASSVDFFNEWFMAFAPKAYRTTRAARSAEVIAAIRNSGNLIALDATFLRSHPRTLQILRMATAPPLAQDRLVGLAKIPKTLLQNMEVRGRISPLMDPATSKAHLESIIEVISSLVDEDLFPWVSDRAETSDAEITRAATVVADRLTGAVSDPIVRNAQEQRQLSSVKGFLEKLGYKDVTGTPGLVAHEMEAGTFAFRLNVPGRLEDGRTVGIPVDAVVKPLTPLGAPPLLIEAKSAGDFTNVNKRRKEEAQKVVNLRRRYSDSFRFILYLGGYFDAGYLGYAAADAIDWVWEHRIEDLKEFGL